MPQEKVREGFNIAATIWSAFVMDRVNGNSDYQAMMRKQLGVQCQDNPLIRALVDRRVKHSADHDLSHSIASRSKPAEQSIRLDLCRHSPIPEAYSATTHRPANEPST